jgi:RimJ/RimL family protein N-acetyltransferase
MQPKDAINLMELQVETLYRCDPDGRLRCVNEPGDPPAPRFFMGRTAGGNLWRFRHDLPADLVQTLEQICRAEPTSDELTQPPQGYAGIRAALAADAPIVSEFRGPAYRAPVDMPHLPGAMLIEATSVQMLDRWFADLIPGWEAAQPIAVVLEQASAVAVCFCSRVGDRAAEAGVETVPAFRGRGYAAAAVATWAAEVRWRGLLPLYSTSWDNLASQGVARKLGMQRYGEDWSIG